MNPSPRLVFPSRYLRFGPFELDLQLEQLRAKGARVNVHGGKVYQTLVALLEKPGEVMTREQLRHRLWNDEKLVNYDANVNTIVNKLRQALGDFTGESTYIETIPRSGYVFVAQVEYSDVALPVPPLVAQVSPEERRPVATGVTFERARIPSAVILIGLVFAGMVVGAAIVTIWMEHLSGAGHPWH